MRSVASFRDARADPARIPRHLNPFLTLSQANFAGSSAVGGTARAGLKLGADVALGDLKLFAFLKTKMQWHQARQRVLAENVANADTPRYRPNDLKPMSFESRVAAGGSGALLPMRTNVAHIKGSPMPAPGPFASARGGGWEVTPAGNAVVLEEQMIKVSENQFDFQMASTLYSRSLGLLRTAVGRNG